ncbi:low molecular weight phosphotyrosine protein phosphatase [Candidatus Sumerlaeota bacterium]|nr:low molecular weight phosphotyrosine protein phosphatase [Candidatus Sumerlaeota bacterium]
MPAKKKILFVCMGNICRSPAAEGVFRSIVERRGLADRFHIDSAGTIGAHEGEGADRRMLAAAMSRGYNLESCIARKVQPRDLDEYDLILAMDRDNLFHLHSLDRGGRHEHKIKLLCDYDPDGQFREVPDPYYGGPEGFNKVLDIVEKASERLLDDLMRDESSR